MITQLSAWLAWQETLHHSAIELGLERIQTVLQRLQFQRPVCPVITVAGTKGKGSCAAILSSILVAAGYRVGLFTSPHLQRYNERIRISHQEVSDESLCVAFERINAARGDVSLTYFEFNTLAALLIFNTAALDVWILEVGMGGRLDAVNVMDADVAVLTSIGIDHTEWLGNDLDSIGREKAGIMRTGKPALFAAPDMPNSIQVVANQLNTPLLRAGRDFDFTREGEYWSWWFQYASQTVQREALPLPGIAGAVQLQNASVALAALQLLITRLPVAQDAIEIGLREVTLKGRFQIIKSNRVSGAEWLLDVAHNPMSAAVLAAHLQTYLDKNSVRGKVIAIVGVLADKDVRGMLAALSHLVDSWIVIDLPGSRALPGAQLRAMLQEIGGTVWAIMNEVSAACEFANQRLRPDDRVLICGSFMTVGPALNYLETNNQLI